MAGLVSRFGNWLDSKWEEKATVSLLEHSFHLLEISAINDKVELLNKIKGYEKLIADAGREAAVMHKDVTTRLETIEKSLDAQVDKDTPQINDLKTRIERLEIYSGITRKVDPSKPAMLKSPFEM